MSNEAENSIILTSVNEIITQGNDNGFTYEYTYQNREYIIRTLNTKHAHCTYYTLSLKSNQVFLLRLHIRLHSVILSTFVIKLLRQC